MRTENRFQGDGLFSSGFGAKVSPALGQFATFGRNLQFVQPLFNPRIPSVVWVCQGEGDNYQGRPCIRRPAPPKADPCPPGWKCICTKEEEPPIRPPSPRPVPSPVILPPPVVRPPVVLPPPPVVQPPVILPPPVLQPPVIPPPVIPPPVVQPPPQQDLAPVLCALLQEKWPYVSSKAKNQKPPGSPGKTLLNYSEAAALSEALDLVLEPLTEEELEGTPDESEGSRCRRELHSGSYYPIVIRLQERLKAFLNPWTQEFWSLIDSSGLSVDAVLASVRARCPRLPIPPRPEEDFFEISHGEANVTGKAVECAIMIGREGVSDALLPVAGVIGGTALLALLL